MPGNVATALAFALLQTGTDPAPAGSATVRLPSAGPNGCAPAANGDIVVCGKRDNEQFRLRPLPPLPEHKNALTRPMDVKIGPVHWHGLSATIDF